MVAAADASEKDGRMSIVQIVSNKNRTLKIKNKIHHEEWGNNILGIAEVAVLLELVIVIERRGRRIQHRKFKISFDDRRNHRKIVENMHKSNKHVQEAGAEIVKIAKMKKIIKKIKFEIVIKLIRGYEKKIETHK